MTASVSTIIPCYRCVETINRAVDSVAKQTLLPAELILVDDGSGDSTLEKLLQIQDDYGKDWIKVLGLKHNSGPAIARNAGWDLASCDYLAFLDADDTWHPEKIAVQYEWMRQNPEISLSGHRVEIQKSDNQITHEPRPTNIKSQKINRNKILLSNVFCTSSAMIKRSISQRFNPAFRYSQDYFLWIEIILGQNQASILDFPICYYFKPPFGAGGQTKNLLNGKAAEAEIYRQLWKARAITFIEWRILSLLSLAKYYRRVLICSLRKHSAISGQRSAFD
ncbi:family 2 glycosyl transferase [Cylindrospermum sp. NIES-4074]|nr:family 2 glycosyl transferase [Cylindrospermum sp. NIES-4074]